MTSAHGHSSHQSWIGLAPHTPSVPPVRPCVRRLPRASGLIDPELSILRCRWCVRAGDAASASFRNFSEAIASISFIAATRTSSFNALSMNRSTPAAVMTRAKPPSSVFAAVAYTQGETKMEIQEHTVKTEAVADAKHTCEKQQQLLGIHLQQPALRQLENRQSKTEKCGRPFHDDDVPHAQRNLIWPVVHEQRQQPLFRCTHVHHQPRACVLL